MAVSDYKTNPDENTTISGINIAEGCPPSGINNAIRQLMADVKSGYDAQADTNKSLENIATTIMTGATASAAGTSGNVPAPSAGKQNKPLNGAGQWADFLDCVVRAIRNSDGTDIDAAKLLEMLSKYLPLTGGRLSGSLTVPSTFTVKAQGNEGGEIRLEKGNTSSEGAVIDQQLNYLRFFGDITKNSKARVNLVSGDYEGQFTGGFTQFFAGRYSNGVDVPPGGTWHVCGIPDHGGTDNRACLVEYVAGGTHLTWSYGGYSFLAFGIKRQ